MSQAQTLPELTEEQREELQQYLATCSQHGVENIQAMFRQMMLRYAPEGESLEATKKRIMADPATHKIAETLGCPIEKLMEGFGKKETFWTHTGYDAKAASARVKRVREKILSTPLGVDDQRLSSDGLQKENIRVLGEKKAPHVETKRGQITGKDKGAIDLLKKQMYQVQAQRMARPAK